MAPYQEEIDRLLTEQEAAPLIGVRPQTMCKWRMQGNPDAPKFIKIGRSCRYKLSTLKEWMASRQEISCTQQSEGVQ
jgi:predicted DNA-binding transcriptional regulator AlpA